jgi:hypothetical protein
VKITDILGSWVGRSVHVEVLSGVGERTMGPAEKTSYRLGIAEAVGILEEVSERGIILADERTGDLFFSWNAILRIQPHRANGTRRG